MSESGEIFLHNQFLLEGLWGGGVGGWGVYTEDVPKYF